MDTVKCGTASPSDIETFMQKEKQLKEAIRLIEELHGRNPWHEHQQTLFYFKGFLAGITWMARLKGL